MIRSTRSMAIALFFGLCGCLCPQTPIAAQVCDGWVPIGDPIQRAYPGWAVDHQQSRVFLYGGTTTSSDSSSNGGASDLWRLQAGRWRPAVEISGPLARISPVLVWDEARARLVLIGGAGAIDANSSVDNRSRTWEFDGETWIDRGSIGGPIGSEFAAGDFDPGRGCLWAVTSNRLWRYDGLAWQEQLNPGGGALWPSFSKPQAAFDRAAGVLRVINGQFTGSLWTWNGSAWQSHAGTSTSAIGLSYDRVLGRVVVAEAASNQIRFRSWDSAAWVSEASIPAFSLTGSISGLIVKLYRDESDRMNLVIAGAAPPPALGATNDGRSLVYSAVLADGQWVPRTVPPTPGARFKPALAFSPPQGGTALVGGTSVYNTGGSAAFDDYWLLRGERWLQQPSSGIPRNYGIPLFYNPQTQLLTAIGASAGGQTTLHELTPQGWSTRQIPGTAASFDKIAVWDAAGGSAVVAGHESTSPLFRCDGQSIGTIQFSQSFPNQNTAGIVYDAGRQKTLVTGVSGSMTVYQITGATWNSFASTGSFNTYNPLFVHDPVRGGVVSFGGFLWSQGGTAYPINSALLTPASNAWTPLAARVPVGFKYTTAAWDDQAQRIVVFGGLLSNNAPSRMTLRLSQGPAQIGVPPVADSTAALGQAIALEAVARGGGIIRYQWLKDDEPLVESDRVRGVDTDALLISSVTADDAGLYQLRVTNRCGTAVSSGSRVAVTNPSCPADIGRAGGVSGPDGGLDNNDFIVFIGFFFDGDPAADIGAAGGVDLSDGQFDNNDFIVFINRFFTPCS